MRTVYINTAEITDRPSFHRVFQRAFGFPDFYGANMDAWVDCMSLLNDPEAGMSTVTLAPGEVVMLEVPDSLDFAASRPDIWLDLVEGCAFVNQRLTDRGELAVVALLMR